jgi:hypothetical protein
MAANKAGQSGWSPGGSATIVQHGNASATTNTCAYDIHEFDVNKRLVCVESVPAGTRLDLEHCSKQLNLIQYHRVMSGPLANRVIAQSAVALEFGYPGTCQY